MKKIHLHIRNEIKVIILILVAFSAIALTEKKDDERVCKSINIDIKNLTENHYLDNNDIYRLMTGDESDFVMGSYLNQIDLKMIETRIIDNAYVESADAFTDFKGNLNLCVTLRKPVARIIPRIRSDFYLDRSGNIFPVSERFTSRVLLVSGSYADTIVEKGIHCSDLSKNILRLICFIHEDEFWNAQIAQLEINSKGEITMIPQVTKQYIEFGKPENIDKKFMKLKIFYKQILPGKGWNSYSRVNVQYKDQIICE